MCLYVQDMESPLTALQPTSMPARATLVTNLSTRLLYLICPTGTEHLLCMTLNPILHQYF